MTTAAGIFDFYCQPGAMTDPGRFAPALAAIDGGLESIVRAVQGVYIHEHIAGAYGVTQGRIRPISGSWR